MAEGLATSAHGKRVACGADARCVSDGPFSPADALVAGFRLWEVGDLDVAVAWVKRWPNPIPVSGEIEILPMYG